MATRQRRVRLEERRAAAARGDPCRVVDCDRPIGVVWLGLCRSHYETRWRRPTTPTANHVEIPRSFRGLGVIACRLCGRALRDHDGPCQLRYTKAIDTAVAGSLRLPLEVRRNGQRSRRPTMRSGSISPELPRSRL